MFAGTFLENEDGLTTCSLVNVLVDFFMCWAW